jgi:hypothetical protein
MTPERELLRAAASGLRSYQYGNSSPDLAESIADKIDALLTMSATQRIEAKIEAFIVDVAELPDRTSPDDWPEAMLVTAPELDRLLREHFGEAPLSETPPSGTAKVPKRMTTIEDAFPLAGEYESDARYHWRERWDAAKSYVHEVEELANKMREIWARRAHQLQPPLTDEEIAWADEYVASQSGNEEKGK